MPPRGGTPGSSSDFEGTDPSKLKSPSHFARALTDHRLRAGLSVREVAKRTGVPVSTLSGYFSGRHLPPATRPQVLESVLDTLGVSAADRPRWQAAVRRLSRRSPAPSASPYRGLRAFQTANAALVRGRSVFMAFDASGATLLVGGDDNVVKVVDLSSGSPRVSAVLEGPTNDVAGLAISPDGTMVAAASLDTYVWLWRRNGDAWGTPTKAPTGGHGHAFTVAFHPSKPVLVGSGADGRIQLWDAASDLREVGTLWGPNNDVLQVAFSPDGALAAASLDKTVFVWQGEAVERAIDGSDADRAFALRSAGTGFYGDTWSQEGHVLAEGGADWVVRAWVADPGGAATDVRSTSGIR